MCEHRLWPDVAEVVCRRTDPHVAGMECRYVDDLAAHTVRRTRHDRTDYPWSVAV